jgi:hypothetical protein
MVDIPAKLDLLDFFYSDSRKASYVHSIFNVHVIKAISSI